MMYSITSGAPGDDWYAQTPEKALEMTRVDLIVKPLTMKEISLVYMLILGS